MEEKNGSTGIGHIPGDRRRGRLAGRDPDERGGFGLLGNIIVGVIGAVV